MPIKIQDQLPSKDILEQENIFIMTEERAQAQDIRPLHILLLNLMPTKIETETQILRLMSNSPLQTEFEFLHMKSHISKNTSASHIKKFYQTFEQVKHRKFDGMIVTGAPVELMEFEEVDYWEELCTVFEWAKRNVYSTFHLCWGAQAGLYYHYGVPKYRLDEKLHGVFPHRVLQPLHPLLRGFDDVFFAPHSRYTDNKREDIEKCGELIVLAGSDQAGVYISATKNGRQFFVSGHSEYDRMTLKGEYFRDVNKGLEPPLPYNYFTDGDPLSTPAHTWRSHANLLYTNWLNYYVYQQTPYNLGDID